MKRLIQHWLAEQASRRPDSPAIVMKNRSMSYRELDARSTQLARMLKHWKCRPGDRIGFMIPKSPEAYVSIFGILKADCIYVPLDPAGPPERTIKMVQKADVSWILANGRAEDKTGRLLSGIHPSDELRLGWMDSGSAAVKMSVKPDFYINDLDAFSTEPPEYQNSPDSPAHILFTSGSTGEPKGVVNTHLNNIHFINWAVKYFGITAEDRLSGHPPLHFDLSHLDLFSTVAAGAQLHPVPPHFNVFPKFISDFIRSRKLTQWFSVPSVLSLMANMNVVKTGDFPDLRRIMWCGEVLPTASLVYHMKRLPHVQFTNLYGPTETTIASSYYTIPECPVEETKPVPIGKACSGEKLYVLDGAMKPVEARQVGGLYISGKGVGKGYWNDPKKTDEVFIPNPFSDNPDELMYKTGDLAVIDEDGLAYFHGREDSQIKSRGYRIEPGEVENALYSLQLTLECAVVGVPSNEFGSPILGCGYVTGPETTIDIKQLKQKLGELLPAYMIPEKWKEFEVLPKNKNGKIDRMLIRESFLQNETEAIKNR